MRKSSCRRRLEPRRAGLALCSAALAVLFAAACGGTTASGSGGTGGSGTGGASGTCPSPIAGPFFSTGDSCAAFALGQSCGFGDEPSFDCTCTKSGATQAWVCMQSGPGSSSSSSSGAGDAGGG